jgi:hypothetical protein
MPATSKAQFRFMMGICKGNLKSKGISKSTACEFVRGQSPKGLPAKLNEYKKRTQRGN